MVPWAGEDVMTVDTYHDALPAQLAELECDLAFGTHNPFGFDD